MNQSLASAYSPPFKIVSKYFIAAIFSFAMLNLFALLSYDKVLGFHFTPRLLALTHIATLGWISMIIFGALFQLIPVVLEVKLWSEKLAEIQFWFYSLGIIGLVYGFWFFDANVYFIISGILINLAFIIFMINAIATFMRVKQWNLTGKFIAAAIFYLIITGIIGLLLSINLYKPFIQTDHLRYLNIHVHIAFIGWIVMIIMGVSFKLIPMFTLAHGFSLKFGKISFALINIGLVGFASSVFFEFSELIRAIFSLIIALGVISYLIQLFQIVKSRIKKKIDLGIRISLISFVFMGFAAAIGFVLNLTGVLFLNNVGLIYGVVIIFGFISVLIVGQMYKIVPFLVWYHKYSSKVGEEKVPMLKDLFDEKLADIGFYILLCGIVAVLASFLINTNMILLIGLCLTFIGSLIFSYNMITIFRR